MLARFHGYTKWARMWFQMFLQSRDSLCTIKLPIHPVEVKKKSKTVVFLAKNLFVWNGNPSHPNPSVIPYSNHQSCLCLFTVTPKVYCVLCQWALSTYMFISTGYPLYTRSTYYECPLLLHWPHITLPGITVHIKSATTFKISNLKFTLPNTLPWILTTQPTTSGYISRTRLLETTFCIIPASQDSLR